LLSLVIFSGGSFHHTFNGETGAFDFDQMISQQRTILVEVMAEGAVVDEEEAR
jgi:hypothetical protein